MVAVGDCVANQPVPLDGAFEPIHQIIQGADLAIANLEGTLLDTPPSNFVEHPDISHGCILGTTQFANNLKHMGFKMVSRANNHVLDFGIDGMRQTNLALDLAGIVHSGSGEDKTTAEAPCFIETAHGRIGLLSAASTFAPGSRSTSRHDKAPGRPGVNALRSTPYVLLTRGEMKTLRRIRDQQPIGSVSEYQHEVNVQLELFGVHYRVGDRRGLSYSVNLRDEDAILEQVQDTKKKSDVLIFSLHSHEPGNWSDVPADFLVEFAHKVVDAGADLIIGHGPHQLRGVEIYRGCPIFYSLGNFIFQVHTLHPTVKDYYEEQRNELGSEDIELLKLWKTFVLGTGVWYRSVITTIQICDGRAARILLSPLDLSGDPDLSCPGIPRLASEPVAKAILERLQVLSAPLGTRIRRRKNVGIVHLRR